ncbi:MAG: response regulator [Cytophagales bacterium]|nr:response regulator [Cytophagales bacterium]
MNDPKKKILLVDDLDAIRNIVSARLRIKGFEITKAHDGEEALRILTDAPEYFDLILSDFDMPKMNGLELLEKVRSNVALKNKPFIMLTSRTEPEKMKAAKEIGLSAWVKKPFKVDSFLSQINYALEK